MSCKITAVILAAGKGTRMKSDLPKVLHSIAGQSMISHVTDTVNELGIDHIITVVSPSQDAVKIEINTLHDNVQFVTQTEQLGTAHAVATALPNVREDDDFIIVLYGDTPFVAKDTIDKMIDTISHDEKCGVVVLGFDTPEPGGYGRLVTEGDILDQIVEFKEATEEQKRITLCNSGVMAIQGKHADRFLSQVDNNNSKGEYYLTDVVAIAKEQGYVSKFISTKESEVMGVNSQAERAQAEEILQNKLRRQAMDEGVMMIDPSSVWLQKDTQFGRNVILHPHVVIKDNVVIGDNVEIKSFSHLEGCVVGDNSAIGPYARLRPGTNIGKEVKIGNFVEIKKADIHDDAKISHLSYIGDASVGKSSNIGAGVITCNYDGYNKYTTTIESDCFIGSNSSLVAPVNVKEGSIVAAGSTIIKNVPKHAIALNRMPQENREEKAEQFRQKKTKE